MINFSGVIKKTSVRDNHILKRIEIVKHPLIFLFWHTCPRLILRGCLCFLPGGCKFTLQKGINLLRYDTSSIFSILVIEYSSHNKCC